MMHPAHLLRRLDEIGASLQRSGYALAILAFIEQHFEVSPGIASTIRERAF